MQCVREENVCNEREKNKDIDKRKRVDCEPRVQVQLLVRSEDEIDEENMQDTRPLPDSRRSECEQGIAHDARCGPTTSF